MGIERIRPGTSYPLFDVAATRRIEHAAAMRLPTHTLMQRAGLATARLALALAPHARTIWIACGPGNNGGDGFEAAAQLKRLGKDAVVTWSGDEARTPVDAKASLARARSAGVAFADEPPELAETDLCIDALLGIGAMRPLDGAMSSWLDTMRNGIASVLSIDVPSGLNSDHGTFATDSIANNRELERWSGRFHADHTLSLLTLKPGLFTASGRDACGTVWLDDLGVAANGEQPCATLAGAPAATTRRHASHKGSHGDVVVIGGAPGMAGAALLAARAALHSGSGRVFVALLDESAPSLDPSQPELMLRRPDSLDLSTMTVVCGCGGGDAVRVVLPRVLSTARQLVLDADALNAIAADPSLQALLRSRSSRRPGSTVITPHPLEAARLLAGSTAGVQADRLAAARGLAQRFACVAVLKGSGTITAAPDAMPAINPTGNALLATAGTGDVLAGMIGALLAQVTPAFEAACAAVYPHGLAADEWPRSEPLVAGRLAQRSAGHP